MAEHSKTALTTRSGRVFDLRLPSADDVAITDVVHALSNLCRFGGHTRSFFSVAQHSVECAELSLEITDKDDPERLDKAYACLMHDAHEAYLLDVPSPTKHALGDAFRLFEQPIHQAVMEAVGALELIDKHHGHVKHVDTEMLWSDAIRCGMDGVETTQSGVEIGIPRRWVPKGFVPHFANHTAWDHRTASEEFLRTFFTLNGGSRVRYGALV